MASKHKRLWGLVNGEPFLTEGKRVKSTGEFWHSFVFYADHLGRERVALHDPPATSWEGIDPKALVDSQQIARKFGCTARTVANHVTAGLLKVAKQKGKTFYFLKKDVDRWAKDRMFV